MAIVSRRARMLVIGLVSVGLTAFVQDGGGPTIFATGFGGGPMGMAAALNGDLYVADYQHNLIARITPDRAVTPFIAIDRPRQVVFDGFGDLLVTASDGVWRVTLRGEQALFARFSDATAITIGPDGDVWVGGRGEIVRFSPLGFRKRSLPVPVRRLQRSAPETCTGVTGLAFSPAGQLHFTTFTCLGLYKFDGDVPIRLTRGDEEPSVLPPPPHYESLAFDSHGWLWATRHNRDLALFTPSYELRGRWVGFDNSPTGLVFLRDSTGRVTSRLLASNVGSEGLNRRIIVEMSPQDMGAAGKSIGADFRIDDSPRTALIGSTYEETVRTYPATPALAWTVDSGGLPPGVHVDPLGTITGTPLDTGTYRFIIRAMGAGQFGFARMQFRILGTEPAWWPSQPSVSEAIRALLGFASADLELALQQHFDERGNRNGVPDIGDLRADLRTVGLLP